MISLVGPNAATEFPLPLPTPELQAALDDLYDKRRLDELIDPHEWISGIDNDWPVPPKTDWPRPRLGAIYWPVVGASRYAFAYLLVDEYVLGQLRTQMAAAASNAITVMLRDDPDDELEVAREVPMRFLASRPLVRTTADALTTTDNGTDPVDAWVVTLVDERYTDVTTVPGDAVAISASSWDNLLASFYNNGGDAADADYLTPGARWTNARIKGRSVPWLADIAALSVGMRWVKIPGGLVHIHRPTSTNRNTLATTHTNNATRHIGGGPIETDDYSPGRPEGVRVTFGAPTEATPTTVDALVSGAYDWNTVSYVSHWADAPASTSSGNRTALVAQWMADWLAWQQGMYDTLYAGFIAAPDTGFLWAVEWYHDAGRAVTRFVKPPHWYGYLLAPTAGNSFISSITVQEVDGAPSYTDATTLRFDQTDGFVVSQPAAGIARIDMASASATQVGVVDTTTQAFAGNKTFNDNVTVLGSVFVNTTTGLTGDTLTEKLTVNGAIECADGYYTQSHVSTHFYEAYLTAVGTSTAITGLTTYFGPGLIIQDNATGFGSATFAGVLFFDSTNNRWGVGRSDGTDTVFMVDGAYAVGATSGVTGTLALGATVTGGIITDLGSGSASGTNTGDQLVFKTIAVSGQSDVVADTITDTLTLAAGTNIAITTDAGTDTVTIATSGLGTAALKNTGTSGNTVPLLDGANTWSAAQTITVTDAVTNTVSTVATLDHESSGTPVSPFGGTLDFKLKSSTTASQDAGRIRFNWFDATHASRKGYVFIEATDSAGVRTGVTVGSNGTEATLGFLGASAVVAQTGDVGTAMVTFGLMTGTPTFSASNLNTGTIPSARLPVFVAAGGSHDKGAVPDPGSTAHSNRPYILRDNAAWAFHKGELLSQPSFVSTSETTTSGTAADLTTVQSLSVDVESGGEVLVMVGATHANNTANAVNRLHVDVDGSPVTVAQFTCGAANVNYNMANQYLVTGLSAGNHTIKIKFSCNAGTATFSNRSVSAWSGNN